MYFTFTNALNKGADQTVRMRRLVYALLLACNMSDFLASRRILQNVLINRTITTDIGGDPELTTSNDVKTVWFTQVHRRNVK